MFLKDTESFLMDISRLTLAAEDGLALIKQANPVEAPSTLPGTLIGGGLGALGGGALNYFMQKHLDEKDGKKTNGLQSAGIGALLGALPGAAAGYGINSALNGPASVNINGKNINDTQLSQINSMGNGADSLHNFIQEPFGSSLLGSILHPKGHGLAAFAANAPVAAAVGSPVASAILKHGPLWLRHAAEQAGFNPDVSGSWGGLKTLPSALASKTKETIKDIKGNTNVSEAQPYKRMFEDLKLQAEAEGMGSGVKINPHAGPGPAQVRSPKGGPEDIKALRDYSQASKRMYATAANPARGTEFWQNGRTPSQNFETLLNKEKWRNRGLTIPLGMALYHGGTAAIDSIIDSQRGQKEVVK